MNGPSTRLAHGALPCVLALLGACTTGAPPAQPTAAVEVPAGWSGAEAAGAAGVTATSLDDWWQRFGDPPLNTWVRRALQHNPRVNTAEAAVREAQARRDAAAAALAPTLDASASAQTGTAGGERTGDRFQAGLGANWVPDVFGARRDALDAAAAAARASAATLGDVQVQVATEVTLGYIGLRAAQTRLALARDNLANQQETLQITDWRRQAGLVTALEVDQARAAVAQTEALLPALRTRITQGRHALAVLAGVAPASLLGEGDEPSLAGLMDVPYAFDPMINALSLVFSAAIGVLFGYFPARRAARMDPIEALRHE
jgi:outer membrane protein TolC